MADITKKVSIEVGVNGDKASAAFKGLDEGAQDAVRGIAEQVARLDQKLEAMNAKVASSAKAIESEGQSITTIFRGAREEIAKTAEEANKLQREAQAAHDRAFQEAARNGPIPRRTAAGDAEQRAARDAYVSPDGNSRAGAKGSGSFANFGAEARNAAVEREISLRNQQRLTEQVKEETKRLNAEAAKGSIAGQGLQILKSFLIRDAIKESIRIVEQFGEALVAAYEKGYLTQKLLLATSVDYGQSVKQNIASAYDLASANGVLITSAQGVVAAIAALSEKAGKPVDTPKLSQAVLDLAARRGISAEDAGKAVQNPEQLLGESRDFINFQFARKNGLDPTQLSEQQKAVAIIEELFRRGAAAAGAFKKENDSLIGSLRQLGTLPGALNVLENNPRFAAALGSPGQGLLALKRLFVDPLPASTEDLAKLEKEAKEQAADLAAFNAQEERRKQGELTRKRFEVKLDAATGREVPQQKLEELRGLGRELENLRGAILPEEFDKLSERITNSIGQVERQLKSLRVEASGVKEDLTTKLFVDNPFVKLASDSEKSIAHLRDHFKDLGKSTVDELVRMQEAANATQLSILRFDTDLGALRNHQEAARLRQRFVGLTGPQDRNLAVVNARIAEATTGEDLRRRNLDLENPYRYRDPREDIKNIDRMIRNLEALSVSGSGRAGGEAVANSVLALAGKIDPTVLATSRDPIIRDIKRFVIDANKVKASGLEADTKDAIEREKAGNQLQTNARDQLKLLQASSLPSEQKLKQFIAITGLLSDKELTGDLRLGRANALDLQAKQDAQKEQIAEQRGKILEDVLRKLDLVLSDKGVKVDGALASLNLQVGDGLNIDQVLGAAPTPADTAAHSSPGFAPGFRD